MLKETLLGALVVTGMLVSTAQAASASCGVFEGKYEGNDDHGFVHVTVAPDGTVTGQAQSQVVDAMFTIGGVIKTDGTLATSGSVSSGAQFDGRFVGEMAGGTWRNPIIVNGMPRMLTGNWGVQRTATADGCQQ